LKIVTTNQVADRLLAEQDGLLATRDGLRTESTAESTKLKKLVMSSCSMADDPARSCGGVMDVTRREKPVLHLMVSPARGLDMDGKSAVRAIVFVTDPAERVRPLPESLQQRYRLTPAESRLALLLADGRTLRQISEMLGVSRNTLKSQLDRRVAVPSAARLGFGADGQQICSGRKSRLRRESQDSRWNPYEVSVPTLSSAGLLLDSRRHKRNVWRYAGILAFLSSPSVGFGGRQSQRYCRRDSKSYEVTFGRPRRSTSCLSATV
jgi:DNA-binding CsgD family transcriptional regulator